MNNKLLLPLLVCLLALVGFAWYLLDSDPAAGSRGQQEELGPGLESDALMPDGGRAEELASAPVEVAEPEREAMAEAPKVKLQKTTSDAKSLPSTAIWLDGVVIFPSKMPLDAGGVEVTARGRRFGDKDDPRREYSTGIDRDGRFRIAFSKSTRKGWIDVNGRYLYMEDKLGLKMNELPREVQVEPKLGGVMKGTISAPLGSTWTPQALDSARVTLRKWSGGRFSKTIGVGEGGSFEFTGLPPASNYTITINSKVWAEHSEGGLTVKAGEVTDFSAKLDLGASIYGKVVDRSGAPRAEVSVELMCEPTEDGWHHQTVQTDAQGVFEFRGVVDGDVRLTASADDSLVVEKELGILHDGDVRKSVTMELDGGRSISGVVHWPDGTPAADAWVNISQDKEAQTMRMIFGAEDSEKTAADGSFTVAGLEDSTCVVRASAKGILDADRKRFERSQAKGRKAKLRRRGSTYRVKMESVAPGTSGLVLVLEEGDSVSGKAVDDQGEGISRFLISARPEDGGPSNLDSDDGFERIVVTLDGSFEVDGLRAGTWKLSARADDHASSETVEVTSPGAGEIEFVLPRFGRAHGLVRGPGGEPVSGAAVFVEKAEEGEPPTVDIRVGSWGMDATSDQEGHFVAKDVRPGRKVVYATMEGFGQSAPVYVTVEPGKTLEGVALRLLSGARIEGQVHASAGEISKRRIRIQGQDGLSYNEFVTSSSTGRFEDEGLSPGRYRVELQPKSLDEGGHNSVQYVEVSEGSTGRVVLGSPPADPVTVTGRVTSGGEPQVGISVRCWSTEDRERNRDSTTTDEEGVYALTVSGAGRYDFRVGQRPDDISSTHDVGAGGSEIDFSLPICSLSGVVRGSSGEALEGAALELVRFEDANGKAVSVESKRNLSAEDGGFEFAHLEPGRYYLRVSKSVRRSWMRRDNKEGFGAVLIDDLLLEEGQARSGLEIDLDKGGTISGTVLGSDGQGLGSARIEVLTKSGRKLTSSSPRSGSTGSFTIKDVGEGTYLVRARKDGVTGNSVEVRVYPEAEAEAQLLVDAD